MNKKTQQKGFVILYAVLVAGVVSIGGILLANIIVKQLILSSLGRESQFAYYAANAGDECARLNRQQVFGGYEESFDGTVYSPGDLSLLSCAEGSVAESEGTSEDGHQFHSFAFRVGPEDDNLTCADVKVWVRNDEENNFLVESTGFNYCDNPSHPRSVEKVIFRSSGGNAAD